jgi:hypothetical protein
MSMYPLGSVTIGTTGTPASISFTNIPQTFSTLEIRTFMRNNNTITGGSYAGFYINSDTSNTYSFYYWRADGSGTTSTTTGTSAPAGIQPLGVLERNTSNNDIANTYGVMLTQIPNYTSSTSYKIIKNYGGYDANGTGTCYFTSNCYWGSTNPVTTITINNGDGTSLGFTAGSRVDLYGIL